MTTNQTDWLVFRLSAPSVGRSVCWFLDRSILLTDLSVVCSFGWSVGQSVCLSVARSVVCLVGLAVCHLSVGLSVGWLFSRSCQSVVQSVGR